MANNQILVACEYSGRVRDAFRARGFDAVSCDLLDTEVPGPHIVGNVLDIIQEPWRMIVAHPPCTRLANSGVRWLHERDLWEEMREGAAFFNAMLAGNAPYIAVENPVIHKHARALIGRGPDFTVQPYEHGHADSKRTCFWVKGGLPSLVPTNIIPKEKRVQSVWLASPGPDRWKERSRTFTGIAHAMAEQWGNFLLDSEGS